VAHNGHDGPVTPVARATAATRQPARPETAPLIVGDLQPSDEFMHPVTDDPSFNESMMFNFFDSTQQLGGFVRIGNRVNEDHAEVTFCVFLPGGRLLMQWAKPAISDNTRFDAAGMCFRVIEPGRRLEVDYHGHAVSIADPLEMREPGVALRGNPTVPVVLELDVHNTGPMIGSASGNPRGSVIFLNGVGHYQQAIAAGGELRAGSNRWQLAMYGARDHSWGRRVWSSIYRDRSIWITFGPDLAFICCKTWLDPAAAPEVMGCVIEGATVTPLRRIDVTSRFRPGTHYHMSTDLDLLDAIGRQFSIAGHVLSYVPLRHRKPGRESVLLGQAITRFELDGRVALGLSEYFDAASACQALVDLSKSGQHAHE
jgi:hypothetical protein